MCRKKIHFSWLGRKTKVILLTCNVILGLVYTALIFTIFLPNYSIAFAATTSVMAILLLALCGAYLREGVKFNRLLKTFAEVKPLVINLTRVLIGSSTLLIVAVLLIILLTLLQLVFFPDSNIACQIFQVFYRSIEFGMVVVLAYPLRSFGEQQVPSEVTPSRQAIQLSLKTIESGDKSETKSKQSQESSGVSSEWHWIVCIKKLL